MSFDPRVRVGGGHHNPRIPVDGGHRSTHTPLVGGHHNPHVPVGGGHTSTHTHVGGGHRNSPHVSVGGGYSTAYTPIFGRHRTPISVSGGYTPSVTIHSAHNPYLRPRTVWVASPPVLSLRGKHVCISLGSCALIAGIALLILGIVFMNPAAIGIGAILTLGGAITAGVGGAAKIRTT